MLRYYRTIDDLGSGITADLLFDKPVTMISLPNAQFDVQTGYTNNTGNTGNLVITNNEMVFNFGPPVTPIATGLHVLFNGDGTQQIVVDVTDIVTITTVSLSFFLDTVTNDLFDLISTQLAIDGGFRYRCVAIKNESLLSFQNGQLWVDSQVSDGLISIGFDPAGVNGVPTSSDGLFSPAGVTFSAPIDELTGLSIPTLNTNDVIYLWLERSNPALTPSSVFYLTLGVSGVYV